ncbi:DUF3298 and DUF4163 domain-containing protein [Listeria fleischmannii]|uniref:DUF3298 and DUF4163 domain-containing protein n=1 Tax=Listeria fleischmannii TaxID=1069827 RepID=UPI000254F8DA|nr:DUF3298 and DUF4163 domain-containing protein [Listeria fleischmannii]EIA19876.1 anti-sigma factor [Listeria fleischmannii subsp. coloradonensis]STY35343.1 Anti-sigma-V factor rsiV [Listeria fleischmannii subsp. coloradonensis]
MINKKMAKLRQEYKNVPIPDELTTLVQQAVQKKPKKSYPFLLWGTCSAAVICLIFTFTVVTNSTVANAMRNVPVLNQVVAVLTGQTYADKSKNTEADIKTPKVEGLADSELEKQINDHYIKTSEELYKEYKSYVSKKGEHYAVSSSYDEILNTERLLVVRFSVEKTMASSYTENEYITLDKKEQKLIGLHNLFKDGDYTTIIKNYILQEMKNEMKHDPNKVYWDESEISPAMTAENLENHFYINEKNKLVIMFNEYDVAPGYMGPVGFIIPTKVIEDELINHDYIK